MSETIEVKIPCTGGGFRFASVPCFVNATWEKVSYLIIDIVFYSLF